MKKACILILIIFSTISIHAMALQVTKLTCNYSVNPISLDDPNPRLSWQIICNYRGCTQSAYRILVASSLRSLSLNKGDVWDTKKVKSEQSRYLPYRGCRLISTNTYYWKVEVWDANGNSVWSDVATFKMGLLNPSDWRAHWITASKWFTPPQYRPKGLQLSNRGGWADIDLSKKFTVDHVVLYMADSLSTPNRFVILGSDEFNFKTSKVLVECNNGKQRVTVGEPLVISFKPIACRYIRLQVFADPASKGSTVRQLEVYSKGKNVALMKFTREYNTNWERGHAPFLVDGMPSARDGDTPPADACPSTAAPEFRKTFVLGKIRSAFIYYAALGMADVFINEAKVSDEVLGPPFTDYSKRIMYNCYDITKLLKKGNNAVGVQLGNGFFSTPQLGFGQRQNGNGPPRLLLQLLVILKDGTKRWITTDKTWKWHQSEITFNDIWSGYAEDRHLEQLGWRNSSFNDTRWLNAKETTKLPGKLVARFGPPNKINGLLHPINVKGNHAFFATTSVGWPILKINGHAGQHVTITGNGPGYKMAKLDFIIAKDGQTTLSPKFIIQPGPTDLQVDGLDEPLQSENVAIQYINADLKQMCSFTCSNAYLDTLYQITMRTHRNYINDFPADPNREKQGWTQDAQNMFNTAAYFTDVRDLYWRWWNDMADSQDQQGYLGSVVPMVNRQVYDWNSPWWSGMIVFLPWQHYLYFGNNEIYGRHIPQCAVMSIF